MKSKNAIINLIAVVMVMASYSVSAQEAAQIAKAHHQAEAANIVADFRQFLSLPNVASDHADMQANAAFIQKYIGKRGFTSKVVAAGGAPYVVAERPGAEGAPTVLIYAHFDGQPVISNQWSSPPFEPTLWSDNPLTQGATQLTWEQDALDPNWRIVARSAGDDKAPVIALMAAIDALTAAGAMPDITITLFLDGEEERGSPTLAGVLA